MGDKDTSMLFSKNFELFVEGKRVPIVENSLKFSKGYDEFVDPFPKNTRQFNFYSSHPDFKKWLKDNPLTHAQDMLDSLNKDLKEFYITKPPRNRKERRERARKLEKRIVRFKAYCKEYHIEFKNNS